MEHGGSKNRPFQMFGWEEKAKERKRRDREKDEFSGKVESLGLWADGGVLIQSVQM